MFQANPPKFIKFFHPFLSNNKLCQFLAQNMQEGAQSAQVNTKSTPEDQEWEQFKAKYNKSYASKEEENYRRSIFEKTAKDIKAHNEAFERGENTWTQGIYEWADLTSEEFKATRCGLRSSPKK